MRIIIKLACNDVEVKGQSFPGNRVTVCLLAIQPLLKYL